MGIFLALISLLFQSNKLSSPDGRFDIILYGKDLGDAQYEQRYFLKETGSMDSTLLTISVIHDLRAPVFWWTRDSKKVLYEYKNEGDSLSINVFDVTTKSIVFTTKGYVNTRLSNKNLFMDYDDNLVLYFEPLQQPKVRLAILDLKSYGTEPIVEFENWDVYETPQITKFNKNSGEISLTTKTKDLRKITVIANVDAP